MNNQKSLLPLTALSFLVGIFVLSSPSPIATQAKKFTVQINGENTGSGTIIEREQDKYKVLTSWHVVKYPGEYSITTFDNKKHKIASIKHLPDVDLAIVEFSGKSKKKKPYQVAEFGDSKNITSAFYQAFIKKELLKIAPRNIPIFKSDKQLVDESAFHGQKKTLPDLSKPDVV